MAVDLKPVRFSFVVALFAVNVFLGQGSGFAQENRASPTCDVYPVRRASPFGGFSLPAEVTTKAGPRGGATFAIRQALDNAKSEVLVQAYSFTSASIAEALVKAHQRGVKVQVLLDKSQRTEKYSSADFLANAGIPTKIDAAHAIAHNKVMIIDKEIVITGSFNFTKAAEDLPADLYGGEQRKEPSCHP